MRPTRVWGLAAIVALTIMSAAPATQSPSTQSPAVPTLDRYKQEVAASIDGMHDFAQQMVDSVFSFGELGFQEFETQRYLTRHPREGRVHD